MQIFCADALTHFAREDIYILEVSQKGQWSKSKKHRKGPTCLSPVLQVCDRELEVNTERLGEQTGRPSLVWTSSWTWLSSNLNVGIPSQKQWVWLHLSSTMLLLVSYRFLTPTKYRRFQVFFFFLMSRFLDCIMTTAKYSMLMYV